MSLHPIDKQTKRWTDEDLERWMVFCLLERATPYEQVCFAFNTLDALGFTTRRRLKIIGISELTMALRVAHYRFPNQAAKFLKAFGESTINLRTASREEIIETLPGIGFKLASMFLRNTREEEYAVLDTHVKTWLEKQGYSTKNYLQAEKIFKKLAKEKGMSVYELDMKIWQENRIGNRRRKENGSSN